MSNHKEKHHLHGEKSEHKHNEDVHQHEHHHEHHHEQKPITISSHDMSIVGSYRFNIKKSFEQAEVILDDLLKQIAKEVTTLSGIIGHIKAFITCEDKKCMISITEDESNKHYIKSECCNIEGVAIVFYIKPEQLESILVKVFNDYIN
ncbi:hypothetical protein GC105_01150 [Alkalibaculum sp. M08DMB]|uniref:Uncharacterized protein n=1 Tax=Alkalibaculum sporogenes TaxID=2655001 RepID=A0A6A7K4T6_9FIRM|nr:hypothetical protein [Alkalibaculum sporogenes]MPW24398.1 hypothetical protein [Alkalibaculum sporogenes]